MDELSEDFMDQLLTEPEKKVKSKVIERDHRTWFYAIQTSLGTCDNPDCLDDRKKPQVMVWSSPGGEKMCRFCFLAGWLIDG